MFASTESPSTKLAFVLFVGDVLRLRRFGHGCDRRCGSCSSRHDSTGESSTRIARVKGIGLSDTGASMTMDWAYAKESSFDHAFRCDGIGRRRRKLAGDRVSVVLAASLIVWSLVGIGFGCGLWIVDCGFTFACFDEDGCLERGFRCRWRWSCFLRR